MNYKLEKELEYLKEMAVSNNYKKGVFAVLEYNNYDIELCYYENDTTFSYFCCKFEDGEWESDDFSNLEFSIEHLSSENELLQVMLNALKEKYNL